MAVEVYVKSKALDRVVADFYKSAQTQGIPNGAWALLGQVYSTYTAGETRLKLALLPKVWADQVAEVLVRMDANQARAAARKAKAKPKRKARKS